MHHASRCCSRLTQDTLLHKSNSSVTGIRMVSNDPLSISVLMSIMQAMGFDIREKYIFKSGLAGLIYIFLGAVPTVFG